MDKQQQVRDFLEKTVKEKGLSLNALSLKLGKNSTYLFHFVKRHSPKRLDETTRHNLAQILEVNEQSLCDFPLMQNLIQDKLSTLSNFLNFSKGAPDQFIAVDIFDMSGPNRGNFREIKKNMIGKELISHEISALYTSRDPKDLKIVKVSGDTMFPTIHAGDFLWIDTSYTKVLSDGIYLINTQNDAIIRRIQINPLDNSLDISADNKSYKSFSLKDASELEICGKAVFLSHKLD